MFAITVLLAFLALGLAIVSSGGRVPLWPAVFVLGLLELLQLWPQ
jgi:hypothetical protein